jgi:hypothetical protein
MVLPVHVNRILKKHIVCQVSSIRIFVANYRGCNQIGYMKTVSYTIRLDQETFERVEKEARRRKKSLADIFRDTITYGLPALPPVPGMEGVIADTWEKLGPAPEIDYDKL